MFVMIFVVNKNVISKTDLKINISKAVEMENITKQTLRILVR